MITSQIEGQPATSLWCDTMDTDMWCLYRQYSKLSCQTFCAVFSELWRVWTDPHIEVTVEDVWQRCLWKAISEWIALVQLMCDAIFSVTFLCVHVRRAFFCCFHVYSCVACVFQWFSCVFMCGVSIALGP